MSHLVRTHFSLPEALLTDLDKLAGKGNRSSLVLDILQKEVRRRRLLQILDTELPIWKDEDHPELKNGAAAWVRGLRAEWDSRLPKDG